MRIWYLILGAYADVSKEGSCLLQLRGAVAALTADSVSPDVSPPPSGGAAPPSMLGIGAEEVLQPARVPREATTAPVTGAAPSDSPHAEIAAGEDQSLASGLAHAEVVLAALRAERSQPQSHAELTGASAVAPEPLQAQKLFHSGRIGVNTTTAYPPPKDVHYAASQGVGDPEAQLFAGRVLLGVGAAVLLASCGVLWYLYSSSTAPVLSDKMIPELDTAKYVLRAQVVLDHFWLKRKFGDVLTPEIGAATAFLMPSFVIMSGAVSHGTVNWRWANGISRAFAVYIVSKIVLGLIGMGMDAVPWPGTASYAPAWQLPLPGVNCELSGFALCSVAPEMHLWYLFGLVIWRVLLPFWMQLKYPLLLAYVAAVLVPFGVAYPKGITLDLLRVLCYFPHFVLGHVLKTEHNLQSRLAAEVSLAARCAAVGVLIFSVSAIGFGVPNFEAIMGEFTFYDLNFHFWAPTMITEHKRAASLTVADVSARCLVYAVQLAGVWAVTTLMPRGPVAYFTQGGARGAPCYIYHVAFVYLAKRVLYACGVVLNVGDTLAIRGFEVFGVALAVATMVILQSEVVCRALKPLTNPDFSWLTRSTQEQKPVVSMHQG